MSLGDLRRARTQNDIDGELGEEFINEYLTGQELAGNILGFRWESRANPVSPFDFTLQEPAAHVKLDVKSTRGAFERQIHVSTGQLVEMVRGQERYDLFRVYEMTERAAKLRVARDLKTFGERVLNALASLPNGVTVDSVSVQPQEVGAWGSEITLALAPDEE